MGRAKPSRLGVHPNGKQRLAMKTHLFTLSLLLAFAAAQPLAAQADWSDDDPPQDRQEFTQDDDRRADAREAFYDDAPRGAYDRGDRYYRPHPRPRYAYAPRPVPRYYGHGPRYYRPRVVVVPPRPVRVWVPGFWKLGPYGQRYWVQGYWVWK